jgi:hypothetical protein
MKTAYLYNDGDYTFFKVGREIVKFRTSPYLENYTEIKEYDDGYMVLMAQLSTLAAPVEDYMSIKGVYNELELDTSILSQIDEVIIKCRVPIMNKHTGLLPLRVYHEEDILKLVPTAKVYKVGMLYIDFKNMRGEDLIAVLLADVKTDRGLKWAEAAFPTAYRLALGLFKDMRDGFHDYQVRQGSRAPDAMYHDAEKNVMLPIHLFSVDEYGDKEGVDDTFLFYNTRTTDLCSGVYDPKSENYRLENGDSTTSYGLLFGIYRLIGVVLFDDIGVQ